MAYARREALSGHRSAAAPSLGPDHIAHLTARADSTVQSILNREGLGRLDRGGWATAPRPPTRCYQRERPGGLVHVDVKSRRAFPTAAAGGCTAKATPDPGLASSTATSVPP